MSARMTKVYKGKIRAALNRCGEYRFPEPDGDIIVKLSNDPPEYSLRNGATGNTITVEYDLEKIFKLYE